MFDSKSWIKPQAWAHAPLKGVPPRRDDCFQAQCNAASGHYGQTLTSVESIVPMGIGRSRLIENTTEVDASLYTTSREKGTDSAQGKVKRKDLKVDELNETKLLNFFSGVGINFQNIASNDAMIASAINSWTEEGWDLAFVTSGVESHAGETDGNGIFITRFIFKRIKQL